MPNKEPATEGATADISPRDAHQAHRDLSQERGQICCYSQTGSSSSKEDGEGQCTVKAMMNEMHATAMPTTLTVTSGVNGFKVMDPFDWTKDRDIYQCWQFWSEKARHALETMDGDSEDNKISYFHHWINTEGIGQIENWKTNKVLLKQEDLEKLPEQRK